VVMGAGARSTTRTADAASGPGTARQGLADGCAEQLASMRADASYCSRACAERTGRKRRATLQRLRAQQRFWPALHSYRRARPLARS
jgi:hypothetical protein